MGPSSQSGDVAENSSLYGQGERWVLLQVPWLRSGFRACLPGAQPCELCCGAEQAVDPLLIKQQQRCCTLGKCLLHRLRSGDKGGLCWGRSAMELQDKNQAKRPQHAAQVAQEECS